MPAVPGDYLSGQNEDDDSTTITTTPWVVEWDNVYGSNGTSVTYSGGTFTCAKGRYLVQWADYFGGSPASGDAAEIQGRLYVDDVEQQVGAGWAHIRMNSVGSTYGLYINGTCILDIPADDTEVKLKLFRTDTSSGTTLTRSGWNGGITFLALEPNQNYAKYSLSEDKTAFGDGGGENVVWDQTDSERGFSRSGANITVPATARYLVCFHLLMDTDSSGDPTEYTNQLHVGGEDPIGTRTSLYMSGSDGCHDAVMNWAGIVEATADDLIQLESRRRNGSSNDQTLEGSTIQILQLPDGVDCCRGHSQNNDWNTGADYKWDTIDFEDTASLNMAALSAEIQIDTAGNYWAFCSLLALAADEDDALMGGWFEVSETVPGGYQGLTQYTHSSNCNNPGAFTSRFLYDLSTSNRIEFHVWEANGSASGAVYADHSSISVMSLASELYDAVMVAEPATIEVTAYPALLVETGGGVELDATTATIELDAVTATLSLGTVTLSATTATVEVDTYTAELLSIGEPEELAAPTATLEADTYTAVLVLGALSLSAPTATLEVDVVAARLSFGALIDDETTWYTDTQNDTMCVFSSGDAWNILHKDGFVS